MCVQVCACVWGAPAGSQPYNDFVSAVAVDVGNGDGVRLCGLVRRGPSGNPATTNGTRVRLVT